MATKEAKKKAPEEIKEKSIEQLILDQPDGKYLLVPLASQWALVLRRKEEFRHLNQTEILDLALRQLLTAVVSEEQVRAAVAEVMASLPSPSETNGLDFKKAKL